MNSIVASISAAVVEIISAGGLPGIILLMALESACIPIPSEIIMPFAGYLVSQGQFSLVAVATAGALGCNLGSALAYLGMVLGDHWQDDPRLKTAFHVADAVIVVLLLALAGWFLLRRRRARRA